MDSRGVPPPFIDPDPLPPTEFGNYSILGEVARGGVGVIYRARQKGLERVVALKVLQGGATVSGDAVRRFLQEAQSAAKLQHPNIVPIHDYGTHDGQHFFTMDFIEGVSLADRLAQGPVPTREALALVRQVADALDYAHQHHVIHRDIKPGNILIDTEGRVKVTDFGLAKELHADQMQLTVTGQVMGTPRYMSPEQASGKTAEADQRSDVFSLGVTLYELLTGQPAFEADNVMQMLARVCHDDPLPAHKVNPKVHRDAATICMKAMEKDKERRYQSAQEMTDDIDRFLAGEPIAAKATGPLTRGLRKLKRHAKVIAVNVVLLSAALYALAFYLNSRPSWLELQLSPADVEVVLNGQPIDPAALHGPLQLPAGRHQLVVSAEPEYEPQQLDFVTEPADSRALSVALVRRQGTVIVNTDPPDAGVTLLGPAGFRLPLRGPRVEQTLPTGPYAVLVHRENYLARDIEVLVSDRATHTYDISLVPIGVWTVPTSATVLSVPVVSDLDRDGVLEVVVGDDAGNVHCLAAPTRVAKWLRRLEGAVQAPLATSAIGSQTVVFAATTAGKVYCLAGDEGRWVWPQPFEARAAIVGPLLVRDLNADGVGDLVVGAGSVVFALNGRDGSALWQFDTRGRIESAMAWAAGRLYVGNAAKQLSCLDPGSGRLLWSGDLGAPLLSPPRLERLGGHRAILFPTPRSPGDARTMTAVSLDNHTLLGASDRYPQSIELDGDGEPEQLTVGDTGTTCWRGTNQVWHSPYFAVGAYTADMDGDGTLDLVSHNGPDEILILSGITGKLLGQIKLDAPTGRGFALDDVDRDGFPDLIGGVGQSIQCLSFSGGRKRWVARGSNFYDAPFVAVGDRFFAKDNAGQIAGYTAQSGTPLWQVKTSPQPDPYPGIAVGEGVVVDADAPSRLVRAFAAETGKQLWQMRLPTQAEQIGAPAVGPGLALVSDGVAGLYAFELTNGVSRWSIAISNVLTAAAVSSNVFVVTSRTASNYVLSCRALANGGEFWSAGLTGPVPTPPELVDVNGDGFVDVVAMCDNGFVYAFDGRTGGELWPPFQHSPRLKRTGNGIVGGVLATAEGEVIALDLKTGKPRWRHALQEPVMGAPVLAELNGDGVPDVLVATMRHRVRCLSGTGTGELWSYQAGGPFRYARPLPLRQRRGGAPLVVVGSGPPDSALYCLSGSAPSAHDRGWSGPWKALAGDIFLNEPK